MLEIFIPGVEHYDEVTEKFVYPESATLHLEHSLASVSKWETITEKPFLSKNEKTAEELLTYIICMSVPEAIDLEIFNSLTQENLEKINTYISSSQTATTFKELPNSRMNRDIITAEIIYFWMVSLNIPFECQYWHLNRLLTLIKVCNEKNAPKKKLSRREVAEQNRALNEQRRRELGTKG